MRRGVGGHHDPVQIEGLKQLGQGWDLVGLAGHPLLGKHSARGVVQGGQEVRRRILAGARSTHGLAVHRYHPAAVDGAGTRPQP